MIKRAPGRPVFDCFMCVYANFTSDLGHFMSVFGHFFFASCCSVSISDV